MKSYINNLKQPLAKSVLQQYPEISYNAFNKLLRKKDIKVDGKRVADNVTIPAGAKIEVYFDFDKLSLNYKIVYQDDNVLVVDKPQGIEVVGGERDLVTMLSKDLKIPLYACHRIDVNTQGLVVLAKTKSALDNMLEIFKNKFVTKEYLAIAVGKFEKSYEDMKAYLFKDVKKSQVFVYSTQKPNTKFIQTIYQVIKQYDDVALVKITIPTGRTHQIRAHMSYIGHPILGDQKYGNVEINKQYKLKRQYLCAYKIKFNIPKDNNLSYLNDVKFETSAEFLDKLNLN